MMELSPLSGWDNFYVIAGSSAAGLTGLTFVVITLSGGARRVSAAGLYAFLTPTIVHFGAVLAIAAYLSMPHHSELSLSLGLGAAGIAGLVYVGRIFAGIRHLGMDYVPVAEDWIWNVILPAIVYVALLAVALLIWRWPQPSMYGAAAAVVLLMIIGIHNAWDIAVWNTIRRPVDPP
jgi:cytochrome bd-type quinol oxidase subunit 2